MKKTATIDVPTPELDKMLKVKDKSQAIGEFLDWLTSDAGYTLAKYADEDDELYAENVNMERILAEYFGIDQNKCEKERQAILKALQVLEN